MHDLVALYESTLGALWHGDKDGWNAPDSDPCINPWANVTCEDGIITRLSFRGKGLRGSLPPNGLQHLIDQRAPGLSFLDLSLNELADEPPVALVKHCTQSGVTCYGIPPESCTAYGEHARLSMHR